MQRGWAETANGGMPWPTGSQALLLQAAVGPRQGAARAFGQWMQSVDFEAHFDGGTFRLLPLAFDRMRELGVVTPVTGRMKGVYRKSWSETQKLLHDMAPVIAALEAGGVQTMLIKGAPMALGYYRSPALRPMLDLDVVVHKDQVESAMSILKAQGWTPGSNIKPYEMPETHAIDMKNASGRELDLHWHILRETPSAVADAWFWDQSEPFDFQGVATRQPSATAMLAHTIIHGVRSNLEPPIRWIADAMTILQTRGSTLDWSALTQFAKSQRLTYRLRLGLEHLVDNYQAEVPASVIAELRKCSISWIERIENLVYLGEAERMYRPRLFPLIDYWRFLRNEPLGTFLGGFGRYLQRRWQLRHPLQIPLEAAHVLTRNLFARRARP